MVRWLCYSLHSILASCLEQRSERSQPATAANPSIGVAASDSIYEKALWQSSGWAASPTFGFERSGYDSNVLGEVEQDRSRRLFTVTLTRVYSPCGARPAGLHGRQMFGQPTPGTTSLKNSMALI